MSAPDLAAVDAALEAISFGWPLAALAPTLELHGIGLLLTWRTVDRDTGEPHTATNAIAVPVELWGEVGEDAVLAFVYIWILEVLEHEVAESFLVYGGRAFDPHAAEL